MNIEAHHGLHRASREPLPVQTSSSPVVNSKEQLVYGVQPALSGLIFSGVGAI